MHLLIAAQVGFCFVVHLTAGLLVATFERLANQPTGFSAEHILNLEAVTLRPEASSVWTQIADDLRAQPGVERVSIAEWPLLMGGSWNGFIAVDGRGPSEVACQFLNVSPGWVDTMKIRWIEGRDLRADESSVQVAVVNQAFVRQYLGSGSPVGKSFERTEAGGGRVRYRIAGVVANARYRNLREPFSPVAYFPFGGAFERATFVVRTMRGDGAALLRREVARVRPEFRVSDVRTQKDLNQSHAVRERLLAMLALFFAAVAMLLAGVGLYGVLGYAVLQRRREIGIRVAIGARPVAIARLVMAEVFGMVLAGAAAGLAAGLASARFIEPLLYQVKATDVTMLSWPTTVVCLATLLAAAPAVVRALRIDPAAMLRPE